MTAPSVSLPTATVDQTLACVRELARPLAAERVPLGRALGRVLRETVCAPEDQPPFDRSAMDGYAVRLDDDGPEFRIVDRLRAGDWRPRELAAGEAVQIATGAPLPGDGLRVIPKEDAEADGARVRVLRWPEERFVRRRGEDAPAGTPLVREGSRLGPGALSLLAGAGVVCPLVNRLPRVFHLATGNEIVPPENAPGPGQIRDSNSTLVAAFLAQWGIAVEQARVPEDADRARELLEARLRDAEAPELILVSGGASVGPHDFTAALLEELGFTLVIRRTTTRPGKPLLVARREGVLAFGLPGNPLAHFVCLNLYVRAALEGFAGLAQRTDFTAARLAGDLALRPQRRETLWPARLELADTEVRVRPLPWRSSGDLTCLAAANALARIPPGTGHLPAGSAVETLVLAPDLP